MGSRLGFGCKEDVEVGEELDLLLKLSSQVEEEDGGVNGEGFRPLEGDGLNDDHDFVNIQCPLCGVDISGMSDEQRQLHTNECLDREETQAQAQDVSSPSSFSFFFLFSFSVGGIRCYFIGISSYDPSYYCVIRRG